MPAANITMQVAAISAAGSSLTIYAPPVLTVAGDTLRGQVTVTLPTSASNFSPGSSPDIYQIARRPGVDPETVPLTSADVIATLPAQAKTFIDRNPYPGRGSYAARVRLSKNPDVWSYWTDFATSPVFATRLRSSTLSPFTQLELSTGPNSDPTPSEVETARSDRFLVRGQATFELVTDFRSNITANTAVSFVVALRWYDVKGILLSETSKTTALNLVNGESPVGRLVLTAKAPANADKVGINYRLTGYTAGVKVRVENVELYRNDADHPTPWEYVQVGDANGEYPDRRIQDVDQTAFSYDGVGWGVLTASPVGAATKGQYRQTTTVDDTVAFLTQGEWVEILFHQPTSTLRLAVERLIDSSAGMNINPDLSLWQLIYDPNIPNVTAYTSTNAILNPNAETNVLLWTTSPATDPVKFFNGIAEAGPPLTRYTTSPIAGTGSFQTAFSFVGQGVAYTFAGRTFSAGKTYRARVTIRKEASASGTELVTLAFGSSAPRYNAPIAGYKYFHDRATLNISLTSGAVQYEVYWTPMVDTNTAYLAILGGQSNAGYTRMITFDTAEVVEILGYDIPGGTDFATFALKLPGVFSPRHATPYRIRLISGTLRPFALRRDPVRTMDLSNDFNTVLRSLGNMRNASVGELEFRSDHRPPAVRHHIKRGKDHSQVSGGLDLRFGKNITTRRRETDSTNVTNRLILVGYGDDQTQLVIELRSLKDRQGRVPSDPLYRYDLSGNAPTNASWDVYTGGTSEDIYGVRYGVYRDPQLNTTYQAQEVGQSIVELSAWPAETYDLSMVDLDDAPASIEPGDRVMIHFDGRDILKRIVEINSDIARPRELDLVLGENYDETAKRVEQITKDVETVLSYISDASNEDAA